VFAFTVVQTLAVMSMTYPYGRSGLHPVVVEVMKREDANETGGVMRSFRGPRDLGGSLYT
jgi:hypothetical protein